MEIYNSRFSNMPEILINAPRVTFKSRSSLLQIYLAEAAAFPRARLTFGIFAYGPSVFCGIEVKNTARVRPEDLRGLEAFTADYPQADAALLYRGNRRERQ